MAMRTLYLKTNFKRQKPFVFKYSVLIVIYFSHLFLYIKSSFCVPNNIIYLYIYIYIVLYSLTRTTLMSRGKDETRVSRYTYYIYIYIYIINVQYFTFTLNFRHDKHVFHRVFWQSTIFQNVHVKFTS